MGVRDTNVALFSLVLLLLLGLALNFSVIMSRQAAQITRLAQERALEKAREQAQSQAAESRRSSAEEESLEGELLGDVEVEAAAGVLDQLGGAAGAGRVEPGGLGLELGEAVAVEDDLGAPEATAARSRNQAAAARGRGRGSRCGGGGRPAWPRRRCRGRSA